MGLSVVVGTQHPTSKDVDSQVKANLPTVIAFQPRTYSESNVILGRGTHLSTSSLLDALDFLTTHGILVESWAEETGVPSFLPRLRPDSDPFDGPAGEKL